jgi:hypothetical protein
MFFVIWMTAIGTSIFIMLVIEGGAGAAAAMLDTSGLRDARDGAAGARRTA